ncbi:hypothetical protein FOCG_17713 [Fusarium oxysporum f. sp. radicis-lycopersici 26381]|uniref:Uncharacterized protein n=1 Tax=Fusarium oxysporum NRRL 32931 TaxID=660029 RepID=W9HB28_FUSOX|nr:hypothetical protein FOYG_17428 [Fusarium oxysporum NRRL 32931]EXL39684.1 hypothetical protein FOCG_17713 [Fusarium oxysporum f. sp. radicis-lycopersici 26381]
MKLLPASIEYTHMYKMTSLIHRRAPSRKVFTADLRAPV